MPYIDPSLSSGRTPLSMAYGMESAGPGNTDAGHQPNNIYLEWKQSPADQSDRLRRSQRDCHFSGLTYLQSTGRIKRKGRYHT